MNCRRSPAGLLIPGTLALLLAAFPAHGLTLAEAQARAIDAHPALAADDWEVEASAAFAEQARRLPNPELSLEVEDLRWHDQRGRSEAFGIGLGSDGLGGNIGRARSSRDGDGFAGAEWTLSVEQLVETGGKRRKRTEAALREVDVVRAQRAVTEFNLLSETAQVYAEVLGAQESRAVLARALDRLTPLHSAVEKGVEVGKNPPMDALQSLQIVEQVKLALQDGDTELERARQSLAGLWKAQEADFELVEGAFPVFRDLQLDAGLFDRATAHPRYAQWAAAIAAGEAEYALARASRMPDLSVQLGFRTVGASSGSETGWSLGAGGADWTRSSSREDRDYSLLLGVSVPLPIFNRNRGAIAAADYRLRGLESRQAAELRELTRRIAVLATEIRGGAAGLGAIEAGIYPRALEIKSATQAGYNQGRFNAFDYMQVLQDEVAIERDLIARKAALYQKVVELERLTGVPLSGLRSTDEQTTTSAQNAVDVEDAS